MAGRADEGRRADRGAQRAGRSICVVLSEPRDSRLLFWKPRCASKERPARLQPLLRTKPFLEPGPAAGTPRPGSVSTSAHPPAHTCSGSPPPQALQGSPTPLGPSLGLPQHTRGCRDTGGMGGLPREPKGPPCQARPGGSCQEEEAEGRAAHGRDLTTALSFRDRARGRSASSWCPASVLHGQQWRGLGLACWKAGGGRETGMGRPGPGGRGRSGTAPARKPTVPHRRPWGRSGCARVWRLRFQMQPGNGPAGLEPTISPGVRRWRAHTHGAEGWQRDGVRAPVWCLGLAAWLGACARGYGCTHW